MISSSSHLCYLNNHNLHQTDNKTIGQLVGKNQYHGSYIIPYVRHAWQEDSLCQKVIVMTKLVPPYAYKHDTGTWKTTSALPSQFGSLALLCESQLHRQYWLIYIIIFICITLEAPAIQPTLPFFETTSCVIQKCLQGSRLPQISLREHMIDVILVKFWEE